MKMKPAHKNIEKILDTGIKHLNNLKLHCVIWNWKEVPFLLSILIWVNVTFYENQITSMCYYV